jgi:hypothetical protein
MIFVRHGQFPVWRCLLDGLVRYDEAHVAKQPVFAVCEKLCDFGM